MLSQLQWKRQRQRMRNAGVGHIQRVCVGYYWSFAPSPLVSSRSIFISFQPRFSDKYK